ncbi:hypothetical protein [Nocardia sp. IFM 10818]
MTDRTPAPGHPASSTHPARGVVMKDNATHDAEGAIKPDAILSGNAYVLVRLRDAPDAPSRVLAKNPVTCNHGVTMCASCAAQWEWDHLVFYDRTGGGRRLAAAMANAAHP